MKSTVPALLERAACALPDHLAVVDGDYRATWAELATNVQNAARALLALDVAPGDKIAILGPNDRYWIETSLAALSVGAVLVPVNTRYSGYEIHDLLQRTDSTVLLTTTGFLGRDYLDEIRSAGNQDPQTVQGPVAAGLPRLETVVVWPFQGGDQSESSPPGALSWQQFLAGTKHATAADARWRAAAVSPDAPADVVFTSGTTGKSKGAVSLQRHTVDCAIAWAKNVELTPDDNYLIVSPFAHTFGYKAGMLACVASGTTIFPMATFDVDATIDALERDQISVLPGAPTIFQMILDHPRRPHASQLNWRISVTGAATVPVRMVERMYEELGLSNVMTGYGLSEAVTVAMTAPGDPPERVSSAAGRPIAGFEIRVRDPEGRVLAAGETGEIEVRGPNVMAGYLDDPEATASVIDADGWLRTGDVGLLSEDGYLTITDRLKDMFTVGGFNVYPAEIEHELSRLEGVLESAVIGVEHHRLGTVGKAFVQKARGANLTEADVIDHLSKRLANFKVPRQVEFVDDFPRNEAGKILKRVLLDAEVAAAGEKLAAPTTKESPDGLER